MHLSSKKSSQTCAEGVETVYGTTHRQTNTSFPSRPLALFKILLFVILYYVLVFDDRRLLDSPFRGNRLLWLLCGWRPPQVHLDIAHRYSRDERDDSHRNSEEINTANKRHN